MSKLNNANIYIHLSTYPCLASQNPTLKTVTLKNISPRFLTPYYQYPYQSKSTQFKLLSA